MNQVNTAQPRGLQFALVAATILSGLVSFWSTHQLQLALSTEPVEIAEPDLGAFRSLVADPALLLEAARASAQAQSSATQSMRSSRLVVLLALAVAATAVFVTSLRLRWAQGGQFQSARLLSTAALTTAVLRTLDGAQLLAITQKGVAAFDKVIGRSEVAELQLSARLNLPLFSAASVGVTILVAGAFLTLSRYFRSPGVLRVFGQGEPDSDVG